MQVAGGFGRRVVVQVLPDEPNGHVAGPRELAVAAPVGGHLVLPPVERPAVELDDDTLTLVVAVDEEAGDALVDRGGKRYAATLAEAQVPALELRLRVSLEPATEPPHVLRSPAVWRPKLRRADRPDVEGANAVGDRPQLRPVQTDARSTIVRAGVVTTSPGTRRTSRMLRTVTR